MTLFGLEMLRYFAGEEAYKMKVRSVDGDGVIDSVEPVTVTLFRVLSRVEWDASGEVRCVGCAADRARRCAYARLTLRCAVLFCSVRPCDLDD